MPKFEVVQLKVNIHYFGGEEKAWQLYILEREQAGNIKPLQKTYFKVKNNLFKFHIEQIFLNTCAKVFEYQLLTFGQ